MYTNDDGGHSSQENDSEDDAFVSVSQGSYVGIDTAVTPSVVRNIVVQNLYTGMYDAWYDGCTETVGNASPSSRSIYYCCCFAVPRRRTLLTFNS